MDRLANLEVALEAAEEAVKICDWVASEKLSERVRSLLLDMAYGRRPPCARLRAGPDDGVPRGRGESLDRNDPAAAQFAMTLRYDASLGVSRLIGHACRVPG